MYSGGAVVGEATNKLPRDLAHHSPNFYRGGGVTKCEIWHHFRYHSSLSGLRLKMQQDISTLKQIRWPQMMAVCPLQVWWSSVHASLRTFRVFGTPLKIWRRKCAKSSVTLPPNRRRLFDFAHILYSVWTHDARSTTKVQGQGVKKLRSKRDVTRAKICQTVNNSAWGFSISIKFTTDYDYVTYLSRTFKANGSKVKVIAWRDVLAWKIVTLHERIAWLSLNFVQIILEHSATRDTCLRS